MCTSHMEGAYLKALQHATSSFGELSTSVRQVETYLQQQQETQLSQQVRCIQECERSKLHATMALHALRRAEAFSAFSWQHPDAAPLASANAHTPGAMCSCPCHCGQA